MARGVMIIALAVVWPKRPTYPANVFRIGTNVPDYGVSLNPSDFVFVVARPKKRSHNHNVRN